jgi:hypothetical protein
MSAPLIDRIVAAHKEVARSGSAEARSKLARLQDEYRRSGVTIERPGGTATLVEPGRSPAQLRALRLRLEP